MSKPIIPMVSSVLQRAAVTRCGVFNRSYPSGAERFSLQRMPGNGHSVR
jgi:hypothetical protein